MKTSSSAARSLPKAVISLKIDGARKLNFFKVGEILPKQIKQAFSNVTDDWLVTIQSSRSFFQLIEFLREEIPGESGGQNEGEQVS